MSTTTTPGTFQVSTDQMYVLNALEPSQGTRVHQQGVGQLRLDGSGVGSQPHFRAIQLNEFTNWLQEQHRDSTRPQPTPTPENAFGADIDENVQRFDRQLPSARPTPRQAFDQNQIGGVSIERIFRVDSPAADTLNKHLPRPNFDTANYVEPRRLNPSPAQQPIPTDGFDPVRGINETIQRLKADGRVIGDLHQTETSIDCGSRIPPFQWPLLTSNLLGSPAIMNLELNVQKMLTASSNRVMVTSCQRSDGSTTVAIALARQLAIHGSRVLLIDADLGNPTLAQRLGLVDQKSWIQAISNRCSPADLIVNSGATPISLLPLSNVAGRTGWPRKIYDQFAIMIDQISGKFDVVIIDAGPIHQLLAESTAPGIQAAATLLVSGCHGSSAIHLQRAQSGLLSFGMENLLIVQNFSRVSSAGQTMVG